MAFMGGDIWFSTVTWFVIPLMMILRSNNKTNRLNQLSHSDTTAVVCTALLNVIVWWLKGEVQFSLSKLNFFELMSLALPNWTSPEKKGWNKLREISFWTNAILYLSHHPAARGRIVIKVIKYKCILSYRCLWMALMTYY